MLRATGSDQPDTVLADIAIRLLDLGMQMGLPKTQLLEILELDDAQVRNPIARFPLAPLIRLATAIEARSGNVMAGLQIATQISPRSFSDIGYPILFAPDVATALQLFCDIQPFYQNVLQVQLSRDDANTIRLSFDLPHADPDHAAPLSEWVLAAHVGMAQKVADRPLPIREVGFAHSPRRDIDLYQQHFNCPVQFNQAQSYIVLDKDAVAIPAPKRNPDMIETAISVHAAFAQWQAEGKTNLANAYLFCLLQLDRRPVSLERMAKAFGQSERTLRRMLMEEGMPFRDIIDLARRVHFKLYRLEGQLSLGEIAFKLGYSELSAFSRAKKRWDLEGYV